MCFNVFFDQFGHLIASAALCLLVHSPGSLWLIDGWLPVTDCLDVARAKHVCHLNEGLWILHAEEYASVTQTLRGSKVLWGTIPSSGRFETSLKVYPKGVAPISEFPHSGCLPSAHIEGEEFEPWDESWPLSKARCMQWTRDASSFCSNYPLAN